MAHWLGRKFKLSLPRVMRRFWQRNTFGTRTARLIMPTEFPTKWYRLRTLPNPYTTPQTRLERKEVLPLENAWDGSEKRHGAADLREHVYIRDQGRCGWCGSWVAWHECHLDHIRPRHTFNPSTAGDALANLQVLLHKQPCHRQKTQQDLYAIAT